MPRPKPLQKFSSALPNSSDYQALTPRTPHSRTARAEEGDSVFAKLQANANDFDDSIPWEQQQSAPLLHSSTSARFPAGLNPKTDDDDDDDDDDARHKHFTPLSKVLLVVGVLLSGLLLVMIVISWTSPGTLQRYLGLKYEPAQAQSPVKAVVAPSETHSSPAQVTGQSQPKPHGHNAHTISYENYTTFPLTPVQYAQECGKKMSGFMSHGDYWDVSPTMGNMDVEHEDPPPPGTCESTVTYMLSGKVGLAADLALMAATAALARERNRTFFVEDSFWNRGKWQDHFQDVRIGQPGPEPGCRPPPAKEMVACPRTARHWVVNSYTAKYHLGHTFDDHYENAFKHELNRLKEIFEASEESFRTTIRPNLESTGLINLAKQELAKVFTSHRGDLEPTRGENTYFSVHIRRGDRVPQGWEYHRKPIPTKVFFDYIGETANRLYKDDGDDVRRSPVVYIASDSPQDVKELADMYQGPSFSIEQSDIPELKEIASDAEYLQKEFDELPAKKRFSLTRGALVDLALVSGLWDDSNSEPITFDAAICAVSSNFCKLAAIGLGWDDAFGEVSDMGSIDKVHQRWVDVDTKGHEIPVWRPFELF